MRSISAPAPAAMRSIGRAGMTSPSITGCHGTMADHHLTRPSARGSGCATRSAFNSACAASRRSRGTAAIASRVASTPSFSARYRPTRCAVAAEITVMSRPTLGDGAPEQPLGTGHGQQRADAHRTSRLAEDGDVAGIATKGGDILPYPLRGRRPGRASRGWRFPRPDRGSRRRRHDN